MTRMRTSAITLRAALALVALASFLAIGVRAAWEDALGPPLTDDLNLYIPLNTLSALQTKEGLLLVNKTFTVNSDLNVGGATTSQICWNNVCKDDWEALGVHEFVHLYPSDPALNPNPEPPDSGYAALIGTGTSAATLKATSGTPDSSGVMFSGVAGLASSSIAGFSAGVFGDASTIGSGNGYAVLGEVSDGEYQAFAAYFRGKVALLESSDLIVGKWNDPNDPNVAQVVLNARGNSVSEVCLNGVCKSRWDVGGTGYWSLNDKTLWPSSSSRSVSSGNGAFQATSFPSSATVDVSVNGNATMSQIVIGDAPSTLPVGTTCGDGICNGSENDNFCSPRPSCGSYCPEDCDRTAPGDVTDVRPAWNQLSRRLTLAWQFPTDLDYAGTRAVVTRGNPPSGPFGTGDIRDIEKPTTVYITPFLQQGETYYIVLYAYDPAGNYASGVQTTFTVP